jgi:tetratricopeptide (TPR) repeat protein
MLPCPDFIYQCPHCGNYLKRGSLMSGNTFGAKLYSDGKQVAPMLPDFPNLTKCKKCNTIFWLSDLKEVGECDWYSENKEVSLEWKSADNAEFLEIKDLCRALEIEENQSAEKNIRIWIWWAFNDRVREGGGKLFLEETEKDLWEKNCRTLLNLLNVDDFNEKIMIADLYRNLGEFEKCISIIDSIEEKNMNWIKDLMKFMAKKNFSLCFSFQRLHYSKSDSNLPFFQERGELKEKQGNYKGALDDYDKALIVDDKNSFLYVLKGGVYEKLEQYDLALENFNKALTIDSNSPHAYINRSLFYRRRKQYKDAQKDYEKAISLEPRSFNIVSFSEEDIFKYGKLESIVDSKLASISTFKEGTLYVDIFLSHYKKSEVNTSLWLDPKKLPYFIYRKKHQKPILNKRFVKFEFFVAKCIFFIRIHLLRKKIIYINNAVLN